MIAANKNLHDLRAVGVGALGSVTANHRSADRARGSDLYARSTRPEPFAHLAPAESGQQLSARRYYRLDFFVGHCDPGVDAAKMMNDERGKERRFEFTS